MRTINSKHLYDSFMHGANRVIQFRDDLNNINVFPVKDGDTGSNLASMMRSVIRESEIKVSVKETLESIADAAIIGARGNSGIIFAQYLISLSDHINDGETITVEQYAHASTEAVFNVYESIESPTEGTIITVMGEWGRALLDASKNKETLEDIFDAAYEQLAMAVHKTKEQLEVLKKANVVDSGAKGFAKFIEGIIFYIKNQEPFVDVSYIKRHSNDDFLSDGEIHTCNDEFRYCTESLIEGRQVEKTEIRARLLTLGNSLVIIGNNKKCRIHIHTNNPSKVFEYLYTVGEVAYQKVDDMHKQGAVFAEKKSNIAVLTDSIADVSGQLMMEHQIHMIHLDILYKDKIYKDKLTITPSSLLRLIDKEDKLPTSSQPNLKKVENMFDYLSSHYESVIVITVSKELSGTYNTFIKAAEKYGNENFKITVINSKQNSGAQGLLVQKCAELLESGMDHLSTVTLIESMIKESKILVQVKTLDNMIKSGRLSNRLGIFAKKVGLKPIVTLDQDGKGDLYSISVSLDKSDLKLMKHVKKILKTRDIERYCIVHVNNKVGAEKLSHSLSKLISEPPLYICETSSIVAIGAGEGAIAVSYILKKEA